MPVGGTILRSKLTNTFATELPFLSLECKSNSLGLAADVTPTLLLLNQDLAESLNLDPKELSDRPVTRLFCGDFQEYQLPHKPVAQAYSGHQFGQFSPILGDGRAMLLGEVVYRNKDIEDVVEKYRDELYLSTLRDIHLKGVGKNTFSRTGDGRAILGPMLREFIFGLFFEKVKIPTTKSLAVLLTGDRVLRDGYSPGAVNVRVAQSHIRVGTFELVHQYGLLGPLRKLADYSIRRHYPELMMLERQSERMLEFFRRVCRRQISLVSKWMAIGFIHGVLNTDNILISGETIDFGPCAMLDNYRYDSVFSSVDHGKRYAYGKQYSIMMWNLQRFAEAILPLMFDCTLDYHDRKPITEAVESVDTETYKEALQTIYSILEETAHLYLNLYYKEYFKKLALEDLDISDARDFVDDCLDMLESQLIDYTAFFRFLPDYLEDPIGSLNHMGIAEDSNFTPLRQWLERWRSVVLRVSNSKSAVVASRLRDINPLYVPFNHKLDDALKLAEQGDLSYFNNMINAIESPFEISSSFSPNPLKTDCNLPKFVTFCGT